MKSHRLNLAVAGLIVTTGITGAGAQQVTNPSAQSGLDVRALFASNCGFCHGDGRSAGRGPQLMETQRSDEFIRERIKKWQRRCDAGLRPNVQRVRHQRNYQIHP